MISEQEVRIGQNTAMTGLDLLIISRALALPRPLIHKRILDVGAGYSEATATLLNQGADAYALDPKYVDPQTY
ncbi:MAG: hypothetical protein ACD_38C00169G0012 [uncultured bacterium]|uniref:Methyltransferase type 11 n=1 Tax=Candidatus Daviesbacteria bacterium GW2011_GWC2_40_12 TaxID=1618431 RepID=A0A0G0QN95_9BACT|nr:MAG: hypothetical protein ACD_38C00169G0012 [uncultured bacterium]KKR16130.1 MAG: hypothetical protein UT45_C0008G0005 [Candidatus Daviesbacteria bacterium GW2011_GWA2_39_33]KKR25247.1 MAG: hypothetical protein UT54_C0005G0007 [Candidatus Daviesbacteria bacterium GW2011_GWB1_39_5]KKR41909.1 MAG: hypothetical protein UT77_C0005G0024 [Candidatus Daviesbacteria bacterium GW2011_GWC2_40_12]OGE21793.1 MAG: hypothetical protein A2778_04980 [Candidatus Daviesbacteria bacterium RIFCSPHIGHO2_01_FULL_